MSARSYDEVCATWTGPTVWVRQFSDYYEHFVSLHTTEAGAKMFRGGKENRVIPMEWTPAQYGEEGEMFGHPTNKRDRRLAMFSSGQWSVYPLELNHG